MDRYRRRKYRPTVEALDLRSLLSASGLSPAQVATAYGLSGLTFGTQAANGSGQTIAIVDAYNDPNIASELATFDAANNLPAPPSLSVVGQSGTSALPRNDAGWAQEEALDVEWAHALAPGASIVLVEANSTSTDDLIAGVKTATGMPGVSVISMSWGGYEDPYVTSLDPTFTASGITFVAASGDDGPAGGAEWPASSPNVLGVGGTTLQVGSDGTYQGETAWSGSSGGISTIESAPSYQAAVHSGTMRSTPDVAFDGDPNTGVQVYSMNAFSGRGTWLTVGGTSLSAPAWAALVAIADQGRAATNQGSLGSSQTLTALYGLPSSDFHVIGGGYNTQTGLGTPIAPLVITGLVSYRGTPAIIPTPVSTTPKTTTPPTPPIINLPILTQPVTTTPVTSTPVTTMPITITPVTSTPIIVQTVTTPPPAASPISVRQHVKSKPVKKPKVVHHPKTVVKVHAKPSHSRHGAV